MSVWVMFGLLLVLSIVDSGFAGFRAAAGRNGLIFKQNYYRAAVRRGLKFGCLVGGSIGFLYVCAVLGGGFQSMQAEQFRQSGEVMIWVLGSYASLVLVALGIWSSAEADVRTLASVIVLGPFTLIRPWVIAMAAIWAVVLAPNLFVAAWVLVACVSQLAVEPLLNRAFTRRERPA